MVAKNKHVFRYSDKRLAENKHRELKGLGKKPTRIQLRKTKLTLPHSKEVIDTKRYTFSIKEKQKK